MTTADKVREMAIRNGVSVPRTPDLDLAIAVNRLEGIDCDETLILVGQMLKHKVLCEQEAIALVKAHSRDLEHGAEDEHVGPIRRL